ncbi:MAG: rhamnan synthesis F family protein [Lachnoclostridium sp.]|nr:rhamnan synthesis F family protein [Lachnoclostridium sp.]
MKRAALFFMYDKQGVVDRYVINLLCDMKNNSDTLIVVVNGELTKQGRDMIAQYADKLIFRENKGFDVCAYKCGIEYLTNNDLSKWDELVMFNFTSFGPVYPFKEMFDDMDKRNVDFWGITMHYGMETDPYHRCRYKCIPEHIQSSFIAVRRNMLLSEDFKNYWNKMPEIKDYIDAIVNHEAVFTKHFTDLGYKADVYVDTSDLKDIHPYPLMLMPLELIKNRKCPVFKRKTFFNYYDEFLDVSTGVQGKELYMYLRDNKLYDTDLIWESILRTANMYDIKERMQLNYILDENKDINYNSSLSVALMMHIYFYDKIDYCKKYAKSMPVGTDILISTDSKEKKEAIEKSFQSLKDYNVKVLLTQNRGRDVSALLVCFAPYVSNYDLICFVHDKKATQSTPYLIGEEFGYHCFENTLASKEYVKQVINLFENEARLGLLTPPTPHHGPYFKTIGNEWVDNYDNTLAFMEKYDINVPISKDKPCVAPYGTCFWFRSKALKGAYDLGLTYDDFTKEPIGANDGDIMHVIERMYPVFAQQAGYYSAWCMTNNYAEAEINNLYHCLRDYNTDLFGRYGVVERDVLRRNIRNKGGIGLKNRLHALLGEKLYTKLWSIKEKIKNR